MVALWTAHAQLSRFYLDSTPRGRHEPGPQCLTSTRLYFTWPRALWNDVMVKEGISMETPTIMGSIEISQTRPYSSKIKM